MKKYILGVMVLVFIGGGAWWLIKPRGAPFASVIEKDTVMHGDYIVPAGQSMIVRNGAKVTIQGNVDLQGVLQCEDGPLMLVVEGNATFAGTLTCNREEGSLAFDDPFLGIALVVKGDLEFKSTSVVTTNGSLQIVDDEGELALTPEKNRYWYEDANDETGSGEHMGPLTLQGALLPRMSVVGPKRLQLPFVRTAYAASEAQAAVIAQGHRVWIGGRFNVWLPPRKVPQVPRGAGGAEPLLRDFLLHPPEQPQVVLFRFPHARELIFFDTTIQGPEGRAGIDDIERSCVAHGGDGKDAYRFTMWAPSIIVQGTFQLMLGNGGRGGDASTKKSCDPGVALGGKGGQPGNFKITWENKFEFKDAGQFIIQPGAGGRGGNAFAYGRPGGPGQKGGDARAKGGDGASNEKRASVNLTRHIRVKVLETVVGGKAGDATAQAGDGGDESQCGRKGGDGGNAVAKAGNAGKGLHQGGLGGDANAQAGVAGKGGNCPPEPPTQGGEGGKGGMAVSVPSSGGAGKALGTNGSLLREQAGAGGKGGEGCPEGKGGKAGIGRKNPASDGDDGKNNCKTPPPVEPPKDDVDQPPQEQFSVVCDPSKAVLRHGEENVFELKPGPGSPSIDHITVEGNTNLNTFDIDRGVKTSHGVFKLVKAVKGGFWFSYTSIKHVANPIVQDETLIIQAYSARKKRVPVTCTIMVQHDPEVGTQPKDISSGGGGGSTVATGGGGGSTSSPQAKVDGGYETTYLPDDDVTMMSFLWKNTGSPVETITVDWRKVGLPFPVNYTLPFNGVCNEVAGTHKCFLQEPWSADSRTYPFAFILSGRNDVNMAVPVTFSLGEGGDVQRSYPLNIALEKTR